MTSKNNFEKIIHIPSEFPHMIQHQGLGQRLDRKITNLASLPRSNIVGLVGIE